MSTPEAALRDLRRFQVGHIGSGGTRHKQGESEQLDRHCPSHKQRIGLIVVMGTRPLDKDVLSRRNFERRLRRTCEEAAARPRRKRGADNMPGKIGNTKLRNARMQYPQMS